MIAWDSRLEASNAVARALDLLSAADDVHVVLVDPIEGNGRQGAEPGADIAAYLARHGVKVTVDRLASQGRSVGDALRHTRSTWRQNCSSWALAAIRGSGNAFSGA